MAGVLGRGRGASQESRVFLTIDGFEESAPVYNLEIDEYHIYLVGSSLWEFSIWAQNMTDPGTGDGSNVARETAEGLGEPAVRATFLAGGQKFTDVNPTARAVTQEGETVAGLRAPNADRATMHAEIGAMIQAKDAGIRGGAGRLEIEGMTVCAPYCRGDVKTMARSLDLDSLTVKDADDTIYNFPTRQSLQPIKDGGQGWKGS